jgi:glycosyltransferase involved in cell wall biosynthesis
LQTLASGLGIGDRVHFIGRVPHSDVTRYCSVIDVMVFPRISRRLTELVTPLKPLEAMAMGKLVAASDVGGHRELIDDGHNGHLFRAGSIDALAHCLIELLERPSTWSEVIRNGRAFVERERNWQATVARYRDVYAAVLAHVEGHARGRHGF